MISMSDTPVEDAIRLLNEYGIDSTFLVPTPVGYKKSIMDATQPLRIMLRQHNLHTYEFQHQGTDNKVLIPTFLVHSDRLEETEASLYRPITKSGDPRIWFYNLKKYCFPKNLLAILTDGSALFVINMSNKEIIDSIRSSGFVSYILNRISRKENEIAYELLEKLRVINGMGFIPTVTSGDTGVGMTLEYLLGIPPNPRGTPDYKGIELKASRVLGRGGRNRVTLFSQVPNWQKSKLKSSMDILQEYGYVRGGILQLHCTLEAHNPNSQGLYLDVDIENDLLLNKAITASRPDDVVLWELKTLRKRLKEKHPETFWVKATTRRNSSSIEEFRYDKVTYTRSPNILVLSHLIDTRIVTLDYLIKLEGTRARDHGYLFKMFPRDFDLLFPPPVEYTLS